MLSLFHLNQEVETNLGPLKLAQNLLVSFLNKGIVPDWKSFQHELPVFPQGDNLMVIKKYFEEMTEWSFLEEILNQPGVEYFFHGPENIQTTNLSGKKTIQKISLTPEDWQLWLEIISMKFKQNWNVLKPFMSFYGEISGRHFRLSLIHHSTSPNGVSKLVLRSLAQTPHPLSSFGGTELLSQLIQDKNNILIAGSTGSGKTSLLGSLISLIDDSEHLVILEDTYEIPCTNPQQTRLLASHTPETSLKAYLSYTLRLSPDRIILGEMRSQEVIPFLMAMNTGHKGLMGTIHASSAVDALYRLSLLFSLYSENNSLNFDKVMELITRNLEYVVFMKNKKVYEVIKVLGADKGTPFFETLMGSEEGDHLSEKKLNLF